MRNIFFSNSIEIALLVVTSLLIWSGFSQHSAGLEAESITEAKEILVNNVEKQSKDFQEHIENLHADLYQAIDNHFGETEITSQELAGREVFIADYFQKHFPAVDSIIIHTPKTDYHYNYDQTNGLKVKEESNIVEYWIEEIKEPTYATFRGSEIATSNKSFVKKTRLKEKSEEIVIAPGQVGFRKSINQNNQKIADVTAFVNMTKAFEMLNAENEFSDLKYALVEKNDGLLSSNFTSNPEGYLENTNEGDWVISTIVEDGNPVLLAGSTFSLSGNDYSVIQGLDEATFINPENSNITYPFGAALLTLLTLFAFLKYQNYKSKKIASNSKAYASELATQLAIVMKTEDQFIYKINPAGNVVFVSDNVKSVTGYHTSEVIGKRGFKLSDNPINKALVANGKFFGSFPIKDACKIEIVDKYDKAVWLEVVEQEEKNRSGEVIGRFGIAKNITQKIESIENLKASQANKSALLEAIPDGIISLNKDGFLIDWKNPSEKEFKFDFNPSTGSNLLDVFPKQVCSAIFSSFNEAVKTQKAVRSEFTWLENNNKYHYECRILVVSSNSYMILVRDITSQKLFEESLEKEIISAEEASKAKDQFISTVSHELRTPLNGILGMSTLLEETKLSEEQKNFLKTLKFSADSLNKIINDILDFSKIEAGEIQINEQQIDIKELLDEAINNNIELANLKNIPINYLIANNVSQNYLGDEKKILQVLNNLIENAIKFTDKGEISIQANLVRNEDETSSVQFMVKDTGVGIDQQQIPTLFQPFTQIDSTDTRKYGGTGLGLAICAKLVNLMNGQIWVESEVNKGSSFFFTVQIKNAAQTVPANYEAKMEALPNQKENLEILLMDENPITALMFSSNLQKLGHNVKPFRSTQADLPNNIDLIIVNFKSSPGITGDYLRELLSKNFESKPRIIGVGLDTDTSNKNTTGYHFDKEIIFASDMKNFQKQLENTFDSI
ncbi:ATP-binding protein [Cytophagales bacterium SYC-11]